MKTEMAPRSSCDFHYRPGRPEIQLYMEVIASISRGRKSSFLVRGFKYFLFSTLFGEDSHFD